MSYPYERCPDTVVKKFTTPKLLYSMAKIINPMEAGSGEFGITLRGFMQRIERSHLSRLTDPGQVKGMAASSRPAVCENCV